MPIISLFTKLLHFLPGELSHYIALKGLKFIYDVGLLGLIIRKKNSFNDNEIDITSSSHLIGIAAGLDKNGDYIDCLAALGINFIEVGTVTPRPQPGNPKPRIFRNRKEKSLLNRLGFNNKGVDHLVRNLKNRNSEIIVGSSIGRNSDTSNENAFQDYIFCLERVYEFTDYIAVNISSPNTKGLRELSNHEFLDELLKHLKLKQEELSASYSYKPIFIKVSPDESLDNLKIICNSILSNKLDGIICSNTLAIHKSIEGYGGVSGTPLKDKSTANLINVRKFVGEELPIIASGGVMSVGDYKDKIAAGANHVQIYTGFIFEGPKLIKDILKLKSP